MTTFIPQPPRSRLCGQVAVAHLAGITLEESVRLFGHSHGTRTVEVVRVLRGLGFTVPDRPRRLSRPPHTGIAILRGGRGGNWHWAVKDGGLWWDGAFGDEVGRLPEWPLHWRITSWLPVERPSIEG